MMLSDETLVEFRNARQGICLAPVLRPLGLVVRCFVVVSFAILHLLLFYIE